MTDEIVVPEAIVVYWEVPAFSEIQWDPTFFAWAAERPIIEVRPVAFPLMYEYVGVTLIVALADPIVTVSIPLFPEKSAETESFDEPDFDTSARWTPVCFSNTSFAAAITEAAVGVALAPSAALTATAGLKPAAAERRMAIRRRDDMWSTLSPRPESRLWCFESGGAAAESRTAAQPAGRRSHPIADRRRADEIAIV